MANKYQKPYDQDQLDYKIFLFTCLFAVSLAVLSIAIDYFIITTSIKSNVDNVGLVYFILIFLIARIKRIYKPLLYPTLVVIFLVSPSYWLDVGEINMIGALIYVAAIAMAIFIAPRHIRKWVLAAFFSLTILYPVIDTFNQISAGIHNPTTTSSYVHFIFISIGIGFAMNYIKTSYEMERKSIRTFGNSLSDLHRLNLSDWQSIDETFAEYLKTGSKLLEADRAMITKKEWNKWRVMKVNGFQWDEDLEEFNKSYKSEFGEVNSASITSGTEKSIFDIDMKSIMVIPIFVEESFYGHFVYGWQQIREIKDYESEFTELMAQNLGYLIARENRSEEERVTKEALNMSELRFRRVFENTIIGIAVADLNGNFIMVNPAFRKMLGYTEDELLQMNFSQTGHPEDINEDMDQFQRLIKGTIEGYQIEKRNVRKDGSLINISLTVSMIRDTKGKPIYGIGIIEDISQRKKSEQEINTLNDELEESIERLEGANRELESFSYSISHDLRAPLRAINGFSKILVDEYGQNIDDEGKRLINVVAGNAKKMSDLIDDLLSFSKLNRQSKKLENVDLNLLIGEIVEDMRIQYAIDDVVKIPNDLPFVKADKALLRQALINIISNALKFSSKADQPKVVISGVEDENKTTILIEDNGVGFEMKHHNRLFQVFQRLHSELDFKGTGVGLAIVERIINRHGGKVWAESRLGEGAKFTLELPT